ncbi:hypothetical protein AB4161_22915 [Vibrio sp. 10N.286.51.E5]|uniref:hypothetical protein n=1 Tax=Vibrio sp. 10N.286.51.E5 TaxID=3229709 RepID=UPI003553F18F
MVRFFSCSLLALFLVVAGYLYTISPISDPQLSQVMFDVIWLPTVGMAIVTGVLLASSGVLI